MREKKFYPAKVIPQRHPIIKVCKVCGRKRNLVQDRLTKDWWHKGCRKKKLHIITNKEALEQSEIKRDWGRNYPRRSDEKSKAL